MSARLREVVAAFSSKRVLVFGDVMLDRTLSGTVSRTSPEAPVPVVEVEGVADVPGGAANVAMNVVALGGTVHLTGVVGRDEEGEKLCALLQEAGVEAVGLQRESGRPTTLKTRVVAQNQQVVRLDREVRHPPPAQAFAGLFASVQSALADADILLVSDYAKGLTPPRFLQRVIAAAREQGIPVVVDPKGRDFAKYRRCSVILPNARTAAAVENDSMDDVALLAAGRKLLRLVGCQAVVLTRGKEGMLIFEPGRETVHLHTAARQVFDVTGASDTVTATLGLALSTGAALLECCTLANCAAGMVVEKRGTSVVTAAELVAALGDAA